MATLAVAMSVKRPPAASGGGDCRTSPPRPQSRGVLRMRQSHSFHFAALVSRGLFLSLVLAQTTNYRHGEVDTLENVNFSAA